MKDLFSKQAAAYRQYRPEYPQEMYDYIMEQVAGHEAAWDCGTGNGQVAAVLSDFFEEVEATDISANQLKNAIEKHNVYYKLCRAENTHFDDGVFDLITVGQALHWFDFEAFYTEVRRVAKSHAILATWGYGLFKITPEIDAIILDFYTQVVGPFWDEERRHIDAAYKTIPFPFTEVGDRRTFVINKTWQLQDLDGFLNTWSAVQKFIQAKNQNPVEAVIEKVRPLWPNGEQLPVQFPLFLKMGRVK